MDGVGVIVVIVEVVVLERCWALSWLLIDTMWTSHKNCMNQFKSLTAGYVESDKHIESTKHSIKYSSQKNKTVRLSLSSVNK